MNLINQIQKRRFAQRWLDAVVAQDLDLPDDEELSELVAEELRRRWEAFCMLDDRRSGDDDHEGNMWSQ